MIDRKYANRLADVIIDNIFRPYAYFSKIRTSFMEDYEREAVQLHGTVILRLWDNLMSNYKAYDRSRPMLLAEKALACLVRRGVPMSDISRNGMTSTFPLGTLHYRVEKEGAGCGVTPYVCTLSYADLPMRWVALEGEELADFVFDFDDLVGDVIKKVNQRLMDIRIKARQFEILSQTVSSLSETLLSPHGIIWHIADDFHEAMVPILFSKPGCKDLNENIPIDQLAEVLATIPPRMVPIRRKKSTRFPRTLK